jgi:hypothetical protein
VRAAVAMGEQGDVVVSFLSSSLFSGSLCCGP